MLEGLAVSPLSTIISNKHTLVSRKLPALLQSQLTSSTDYWNSLATLALIGKEMKFA